MVFRCCLLLALTFTVSHGLPAKRRGSRDGSVLMPLAEVRSRMRLNLDGLSKRYAESEKRARVERESDIEWALGATRQGLGAARAAHRAAAGKIMGPRIVALDAAVEERAKRLETMDSAVKRAAAALALARSSSKDAADRTNVARAASRATLVSEREKYERLVRAAGTTEAASIAIGVSTLAARLGHLRAIRERSIAACRDTEGEARDALGLEADSLDTMTQLIRELTAQCRAATRNATRAAARAHTAAVRSANVVIASEVLPLCAAADLAPVATRYWGKDRPACAAMATSGAGQGASPRRVPPRVYCPCLLTVPEDQVAAMGWCRLRGVGQHDESTRVLRGACSASRARYLSKQKQANKRGGMGRRLRLATAAAAVPRRTLLSSTADGDSEAGAPGREGPCERLNAAKLGVGGGSASVARGAKVDAAFSLSRSLGALSGRLRRAGGLTRTHAAICEERATSRSAQSVANLKRLRLAAVESSARIGSASRRDATNALARVSDREAALVAAAERHASAALDAVRAEEATLAAVTRQAETARAAVRNAEAAYRSARDRAVSSPSGAAHAAIAKLDAQLAATEASLHEPERAHIAAANDAFAETITRSRGAFEQRRSELSAQLALASTIAGTQHVQGGGNATTSIAATGSSAPTSTSVSATATAAAAPSTLLLSSATIDQMPDGGSAASLEPVLEPLCALEHVIPALEETSSSFKERRCGATLSGVRDALLLRHAAADEATAAELRGLCRCLALVPTATLDAVASCRLGRGSTRARTSLNLGGGVGSVVSSSGGALPSLRRELCDREGLGLPTTRFYAPLSARAKAHWLIPRGTGTVASVQRGVQKSSSTAGSGGSGAGSAVSSSSSIVWSHRGQGSAHGSGISIRGTAWIRVRRPLNATLGLVLRAGLRKTSTCSNHFIVISTKPSMPRVGWSWKPTPNEIKAAWDCDRKVLISPAGSLGALASGLGQGGGVSAECGALQTYTVTIRIGPEGSSFDDSGGCGHLAIAENLGLAARLYVYIGAASSDSKSTSGSNHVRGAASWSFLNVAPPLHFLPPPSSSTRSSSAVATTLLPPLTRGGWKCSAAVATGERGGAPVIARNRAAFVGTRASWCTLRPEFSGGGLQRGEWGVVISATALKDRDCNNHMIRISSPTGIVRLGWRCGVKTLASEESRKTAGGVAAAAVTVLKKALRSALSVPSSSPTAADSTSSSATNTTNTPTTNTTSGAPSATTATTAARAAPRAAATIAVKAECSRFRSYAVTVIVTPTEVVFEDDACATLRVPSDVGASPLLSVAFGADRGGSNVTKAEKLRSLLKLKTMMTTTKDLVKAAAAARWPSVWSGVSARQLEEGIPPV